MTSLLPALLGCLLLPASAFDLPPQPSYSPEQLARLPEITELDLSPDGCLAAFSADLSGAQELWVLPVCGAVGTARQLSRLGEQVTEVHFSPDGKKVLFASDRGGDERRDLFLTDAAGGEPVNLTKSPLAETNPDGVQSGAAFSPDGTRIAYTADPDQPFRFQLMVMDLRTRAVRRLTREAMSVHFPTWSPDGKTLAVTRSGDDHRGELLLVDAVSGALREVKAPTSEGVLRPQGYSPDGKRLLCLATNHRGFMQLALVSVQGRFERFIGPGDWDVEKARWHPKAGIVYLRNEDGRSALYRMAEPPPAAADRREDQEQGGELLYGPEGTLEDFALDAGGDRLALLWGDSRTPAGIYALALSSGSRLERLSPPLEVDVAKLIRGRMIVYRSLGGVDIHALYIPPVSVVLGDPPPLIVSAHGGPDLQVTDAFNPKLQALSQAGFAVLAPNYRGSTGYGRRFLDLNNLDWGGSDLKDLVEGVRHMAVQGLADPERVGITGGSYGGYLTLMALAKTPGIWAAGVEAYGMPDLAFDYETTGERFRPWYRLEMGDPKEKPELYRERSPIHFVGNIGAPLLIFQGENDTNVPKAESELVLRKLREVGSPVEYVLYSDEGHGFTKLKNRLDCYRRMVDFFVKYLSRKAR